MLAITVYSKRIGPIKGRHPWVFSGALKQIPDKIASGTPVKLVDENNNFLAQGYFNSYSQIAVRLWSWDEKEEINQDFFVKRVEQAYALRQAYVENKQTDSYRLINSENDLLPGLIVDKYADYLSVQFHTVGLEYWKKEIVEALQKVVKPKGIYERSDLKKISRERHNLSSSYQEEVPDQRKGGGVAEVLAPTPPATVVSTPSQAEGDKRAELLYGKVPDKVEIMENDIKFYVDIIGGQKTGFFLDQRDKRQALLKYVKGRKVLNCFSYTGGFSVYALSGGAKKVVSVDVSEPALQLAKENVELNDLDLKKCEFVCEDVKKFLNVRTYEPIRNYELRNSEEIKKLGNKEIEQFDVIILDPPAFVKDRKKVREGLLGYRKINEQALRILPPGGILVTASCSAHVGLDDFRFMLSEAAGHTGRTVQIIETFTHGIDHPELVAFTEGEYLKCVFARVM